MKRLDALYKRFTNAKNPADKYRYACLITTYVEDMANRYEQTRNAYFVPGVMILTGEIKSGMLEDELPWEFPEEQTHTK